MAGRGRGRGRNVSFNVEALGFGRGEALPAPILQPPPLYPPTDFKPVPLLQGEEFDYMLALKQEFRGVMKRSAFYQQTSANRKDIDRYSDKYQLNSDTDGKWEPDWRRFPAELKITSKKSRKVGSTVQPNIPKKKKKIDQSDVKKTLEELEKKEEKGDESDEDENEDEKKNEGDEDAEEELYEEDEIEEETDYLLSYFDNGEDDNGGDDDADEGPVY
ncbi:DNA-directed RNA polymerase III subunit RPC7-like [Mizuhopecten yessoensis]|uniref:DNA-directed RNA polymerase III subunit RPC7-like n=1 Tax=Mizuhopecten yessoensis TaxID=6573 RepID=A0A210PY17_MIZYE|nr:DNA-directed RNA polymerase III subunit RPC7-like [Mizuhopecten yessoensis]OWF41375.1 DNA-directed RNA polymerase III subunit RPC7-like [Mizuhopecten yessoensis]